MATGVLAYISEILLRGYDLIFSDSKTNRLPAAVEATLPAAIGKGRKNGVAALNENGDVVDVSGNPAAIIGDGSGRAVDAGFFATAYNTLVAAISARLPLTGGTLTGALVVPTPTAAGHAATKGYVDTKASSTGVTYETAAAGSRWDLPCPGGVQPPRPTRRPDVYFDYVRPIEPTQDLPDGALPGDGWYPEEWPVGL